jgi:hypothetical protein
MARTRTTRSEPPATANDRGRKDTGHAVADADVAQRAYDLYLARGRADGHDVDDWLQAERELRSINEQ